MSKRKKPVMNYVVIDDNGVVHMVTCDKKLAQKARRKSARAWQGSVIEEHKLDEYT